MEPLFGRLLRLAGAAAVGFSIAGCVYEEPGPEYYGRGRYLYEDGPHRGGYGGGQYPSAPRGSRYDREYDEGYYDSYYSKRRYGRDAYDPRRRPSSRYLNDEEPPRYGGRGRDDSEDYRPTPLSDTPGSSGSRAGNPDPPEPPRPPAPLKESTPSEPGPSSASFGKPETQPKTEGSTLPTATRANTPGRVKSPYPPYTELDVTGMLPGALAKDPTNGKVFRVP